jgi:hypothetical protein
MGRLGVSERGILLNHETLCLAAGPGLALFEKPSKKIRYESLAHAPLFNMSVEKQDGAWNSTEDANS